MGPEERPLRFLLLHSRTGGGHLRVARTVADALTARYSDRVQVTLVDVLAEYAPWPLSKSPEWYILGLCGGGRLYGWWFLLLNRKLCVQSIHHLLWPLMRPRAFRLFKDHPADIVVSFHPVLLNSLSRALRLINPSLPFVVVGSELVVMHALWASPYVHRYLVATEEARVQLIHHGVNPERIEVTGLPIRKSFQEATLVESTAIRQKLGLEPTLPTVLVMGGGAGFGPLKQVVSAIAHSCPTAQIVVSTGHNEKMRVQLAAMPWPSRVWIKGFLENIHEWMRAADVLVTKAGPVTIAEALTIGVPMVLWGAIPVQETPNVRLVVDAEAGIWAPGPQRVADAVTFFLKNPGARATAGRQAHQLASPDAAEKIADILWETARCRQSSGETCRSAERISKHQRLLQTC